MVEPINTYSIREIFNSGEYIIPIYQRNYAWGEPEIAQLIQDVYDYAVSEKRTSNYYIGTLVVYERFQENNQVFYETIDGQQRLTTLNILVSVLNRVYKHKIKNPIPHKLNLFFDSRKKSSEALEVISRETDLLQEDPNKDYNPEIMQAYKDIEKTLKKLVIEPSEIVEFYEYLADKVHLVRVAVPPDTDLNHYFEIMNTRGEQLEKHEILKAKLLEILHDDEPSSYTFNLIWEACSDMERYVQYGFNVKQRDALFTRSNWNTPKCFSFKEVVASIYPLRNTGQGDDKPLDSNLEEIVQYKSQISVETSQNEDPPERFTSIVNFQNFLLHVLRVQTEENEVSLDDKRLIDIFDAQLRAKGNKKAKKQFVLDFGYNLLWCKWLFDNYIIKREFIGDKDQWSLKRLKWYRGRGNENRVSYVNTFGVEGEADSLNKELIMLLSMFHVSTPTMVYKNWLNAALYYLFNNWDFNQAEKIDSAEYKEYLSHLTRAYLFDRYLAKEDRIVDFFDIIFVNEAVSVNDGKPENIDLNKLNAGTAVENFIFNYLDYLLWKQQSEDYEKFEFTSRSSVEHYYPQNPIAIDHRLDQATCDNFGNLCLISSSKNSRLSNHMPEAKKDYYYKAGTDSLKQRMMMSFPKWEKDEILKHGEEMKNLLQTS